MAYEAGPTSAGCSTAVCFIDNDELWAGVAKLEAPALLFVLVRWRQRCMGSAKDGTAQVFALSRAAVPEGPALHPDGTARAASPVARPGAVDTRPQSAGSRLTRSIGSRAIRQASMVFPVPTSSAMSNRTGLA